MKTLVIGAIAALALGLGSASAAQRIDKPGLRAPLPDTLVQGEESGAQRWMRAWRDQEIRRQGESDSNWAEHQDSRIGKSARGSDDGVPAARSWRDQDQRRGLRPPKPQG